jgi:hypothetical protein
MKLKPGARVLTLDGASAVVKQTDDRLTQLEPNSLFSLGGLDTDTYRGGAATVREIGPDYTEAIGAGTTNDAPAVAAGATSDKGPSIDKANMALGGGTESTIGTSVDIEGISQRQQEQVVDDRPPPVSAYR